MKILINDYCGYPFQLSLSNELANRGHEIWVTFTSASGGPKAFSEYKSKNMKFINIKMPIVEKQFFLKRWFQEKIFGLEVIKIIKQFKPDIVFSADTPLSAQRYILDYCNKNDIKFVFWLQDIISIAAGSILSKKMGILGKIIGYIFKKIEKDILIKSDHIIAISADFIDIIKEWDINPKDVSIIPNWSSIEKIPLLPKHNEFSKKYDLENKFVILYSGTLGMKHNPSIIIEAAKVLQKEKDILFLVVTDGLGMNYLSDQKLKNNLDNLLLLPLQPFNLFPKVLASADILLVLLEPDAGKYSVPSKVWSGYCAGRTSLLIVPKENLAAKKTKEINAGIVIPNSQSKQLPEKILYIKNNPIQSKKFGENARIYAEQNYKIDNIADKFEIISNNLYG